MPPRSHMPHDQTKEHWDDPKAPLGNDRREQCCDRAKNDESARHKPKARKETRPPGPVMRWCAILRSSMPSAKSAIRKTPERRK